MHYNIILERRKRKDSGCMKARNYVSTYVCMYVCMYVKNEISSGTARTTNRYILCIPNENAHRNHPVGVTSTMAAKRMKPVIQDRISELVSNGM